MFVKLSMNRLSMNNERTKKHTYYQNAGYETGSNGLVKSHAGMDHKTNGNRKGETKSIGLAWNILVAGVPVRNRLIIGVVF